MGDDRAGSIGTLLLRLIENAKAFVRAEIALAKATAFDWVAQAKIALMFLTVAAVLALAGLIVLLAALGMALAPLLGVAGGLAAAALLGLMSAAILVLLAVRLFKGMGA